MKTVFTLKKNFSLHCVVLLLNVFILKLSFAENLDKIIAVVNNHVITESALQKKIHLAEVQMQQSHITPPSKSDLRGHILKQTINTYLLIDAANKQKIKVTDKEINQQINNIAEQNHLSVAQLKQTIEKHGVNFSDYRNQIQQQLTVDFLQQKLVRPFVSVTEDEAKKVAPKIAKQMNESQQFYLEAVNIQIPKLTSKEQFLTLQTKIQEITGKLKSGEDPKTIAIVESSDVFPVTGGDMGWRQTNTLPPQLVAALQTAKPGAVLPPIKTPQGLYILKMTQKKEKAFQHEAKLYHVRHILIRIDDFTNSGLAKEKLLNIRNNLMKGGDFSLLAEHYSEEPKTAAKGGDMGWVDSQSVPEKFAYVLAHLKKGQISQPFQTPEGFELVQIIETKSFNDTREIILNQAKQYLMQQKIDKKMQDVLKDMRANAYVKINN